MKNLILLDPDDAVPVRDVCRPESALRPLPRVDHDMPLYTLLNEFQKGKSQMKDVAVKLDNVNLRPQVTCVKSGVLDRLQRKTVTLKKYPSFQTMIQR